MRLTRAAALTAVLSTVAAMTLAGCETTEATVEGEIIIGADLELTGSGAAIGKAYNDALRLKVDQINTSGVVDGHKIKLVVRDNRSDSNLSLKNIGEFGDDSTVAAVIAGGCSKCVLAASKTINDKHLPTVSLAPSTQVTEPLSARKYIFKVAPNATDTAAALVDEMSKDKKIKKVGLLVTDDPYGVDGEAALRDELEKANIRVAARSEVKITDTDVGPAMRALTDKKPSAIVVWTFAEQAALAAASAKARNFKGRVYFDAAAAGDLFFTGQSAAATEGATMAFTQTMVIDDVIATTPTKATRKQWFRDYTARYGSYYGYASFAADALQLIADALDQIGGVNRERIRDVLETSQLDGLSGPIRITPNNHSGLMPQALTMLVVRRGRWRLAG